MRAFVTNKRKAANDGYYRRYVTGVRGTGLVGSLHRSSARKYHYLETVCAHLCARII